MSQVDEVRTHLQALAERQDKTVSDACLEEGVSPDVAVLLMATIRTVREQATSYLLDSVDVLDRALTDTCEHLTRMTQTLESALVKLQFFDFMQKSGGMVNIEMESVNEIVAWRTQTAEWLEGWFRDIARQSAAAQKAADGQGN